MKKPDPQKLLGLEPNIRNYISTLEHNLSLHDSHRAAVIQWETTMMRLVGEDGIADVEKAINKLKAQAQQATLDQFAMAICGAISSGWGIGSDFSPSSIKWIVSQSYTLAEAMQAESQKRQGG